MISSTRIAETATFGSMRLIARAVAAGRLQTFFTGAEHIPATGPALVVARHYHHLFDGLALFAAMPRPFHILVTLDWIEGRTARVCMAALTRLARWPVVLRTESLGRKSPDFAGSRGPFSPQDAARYRRTAFRDSLHLLAENRLLVIFPEGYPNIDPVFTPKSEPEQFLPFKAGFMVIARAAERRLGAALPIIPAGIRYTAGRTWIARVSFGRPIKRAEFASGRILLDHCERQVRELSK